MSPQGMPQQQQQQQQYIRPQHQLTMPQGMGVDSSQSAPTSPAQSYTNNPLQPQWTPTRFISNIVINNLPLILDIILPLPTIWVAFLV